MMKPATLKIGSIGGRLGPQTRLLGAVHTPQKFSMHCVIVMLGGAAVTLLTWKIKACSLRYTGTLVGSTLPSILSHRIGKVVYMLHAGSEIFHDACMLGGGHMSFHGIHTQLFRVHTVRKYATT